MSILFVLLSSCDLRNVHGMPGLTSTLKQSAKLLYVCLGCKLTAVKLRFVSSYPDAHACREVIITPLSLQYTKLIVMLAMTT
jgi:hypothetical protein